MCIGIPGIRMCLDTHTLSGRDSASGRLVQSEVRNANKVRKICITFSFHIGQSVAIRYENFSVYTIEGRRIDDEAQRLRIE